ncbi:hypothetical protein HMPREF9005_1325 [Actinomyces sp. oral taxon 178 str. F0338]|nr:hypothetical protein HMPREF9005_1325 [Actinomyces sp. oral taxon 178 str. F0338]
MESDEEVNRSIGQLIIRSNNLSVMNIHYSLCCSINRLKW